MGDHEKVIDINVNGTKNLLNACISNKVKFFVYISSSNAVFNGLFPIVDGKEDMPYPDTCIFSIAAFLTKKLEFSSKH